jgi:hypothetical protein
LLSTGLAEFPVIQGVDKLDESADRLGRSRGRDAVIRLDAGHRFLLRVSRITLMRITAQAMLHATGFTTTQV